MEIPGWNISNIEYRSQLAVKIIADPQTGTWEKSVKQLFSQRLFQKRERECTHIHTIPKHNSYILTISNLSAGQQLSLHQVAT